jgi:hypothetical protein
VFAATTAKSRGRRCDLDVEDRSRNCPDLRIDGATAGRKAGRSTALICNGARQTRAAEQGPRDGHSRDRKLIERKDSVVGYITVMRRNEYATQTPFLEHPCFPSG